MFSLMLLDPMRRYYEVSLRGQPEPQQVESRMGGAERNPSEFVPDPIGQTMAKPVIESITLGNCFREANVMGCALLHPSYELTYAGFRQYDVFNIFSPAK
jgi:hypothetical protein